MTSYDLYIWRPGYLDFVNATSKSLRAQWTHLEIFQPLWLWFDAIVAKGQILKNDSAIWSHWMVDV